MAKKKVRMVDQIVKLLKKNREGMRNSELCKALGKVSASISCTIRDNRELFKKDARKRYSLSPSGWEFGLPEGVEATPPAEGENNGAVETLPEEMVIKRDPASLRPRGRADQQALINANSLSVLVERVLKSPLHSLTSSEVEQVSDVIGDIKESGFTLETVFDVVCASATLAEQQNAG